MTIQQFVSEIELQLFQGAPSDDSELSWDQIKHWGTFHLNALVAAECNEKLKRGEQIPPIYIQYADCEVMTKEDDACGGDCEDRFYVTLADDILALNNDMGVLVVTTEDGDEIKRTTFESFTRIKKLKFAKPSIENPLFYRRGSNIYFLGFKEVDIAFEKVNVAYVPVQDLLTESETYEILATDNIITTLIDTVVQRGKMQLYGTQQDTANDGLDAKSQNYHTAIQRPETETE